MTQVVEKVEQHVAILAERADRVHPALLSPVRKLRHPIDNQSREGAPYVLIFARLKYRELLNMTVGVPGKQQ